MVKGDEKFQNRSSLLLLGSVHILKRWVYIDLDRMSFSKRCAITLLRCTQFQDTLYFVLCRFHFAVTMTKRTHDHARPPRATSSTTAMRPVYIVNTTARTLLEPSFYLVPARLVSPQNTPLIKSLVTRFTHLVTSHCIRHTVPQENGKIKNDIQYTHTQENCKVSHYHTQ